MSSQPRLRSQRALATAPLRRSSSRRRTRTAAVTIATALAFLTIATTSVASTGTVYYDGVGNAAAGGPCSTEPSPAPSTTGSAGR